MNDFLTRYSYSINEKSNKRDTKACFIISTNDTCYKSITLNNQFRKHSQK